MTKKQLIKTAIALLVILILGFILHVEIFGRIPIGVVTPNIFLMLTATFGFMIGGFWGMIFGFFAGILQDSFSPDFFGLNCLIYTVIGFLNGHMTKFFYGDELRLPMVLVGVSDVFYGILIYAFMVTIKRAGEFGFYFMNIIMPEAVYTVLVFVFIYYPIVRVFQWIRGEKTRNFI